MVCFWPWCWRLLAGPSEEGASRVFQLLALPSLLPTFLLLFLLGWSVAILFGLLTVRFRDTRHLAEIGLQGLFYMLPIMIPHREHQGAAAGVVLSLQSLSPFLDLLRDPICYGHVPSLMTYAFAATVVLRALHGGDIRLEVRGTEVDLPSVTGQTRHKDIVMARIELEHLNLTFRVRQERSVRLKDFILKRMFLPSRNPVMEVRALQDINLRIDQGDRIGFIGHNGAGKSTMLKLLAGIYQPTSGHRLVEGRISSLFDIALGFEGEANGWENIAYRSYLQGETPASVRAKKMAIAEFSELGDFLNMPVRYYSAGMMVRLAFSIATAIEPEILLVDEVLSVGDLAFQNKARERMREMMAKAHLMVVVSHDLESLSQMCNRVVWLDHGRIKHDGRVCGGHRRLSFVGAGAYRRRRVGVCRERASPL